MGGRDEGLRWSEEVRVRRPLPHFLTALSLLSPHLFSSPPYSALCQACLWRLRHVSSCVHVCRPEHLWQGVNSKSFHGHNHPPTQGKGTFTPECNCILDVHVCTCIAICIHVHTHRHTYRCSWITHKPALTSLIDGGLWVWAQPGPSSGCLSPSHLTTNSF